MDWFFWFFMTLLLGGFFDPPPRSAYVLRMAGACPACGRFPGAGPKRCPRCGKVA
jgi:hypothetical protein